MWLEQDDQEKEKEGMRTERSSGQIILGLVVHAMNFGLYSFFKKKKLY